MFNATFNNYIKAHVRGRFGQRSRLVEVDFVFSLVKSEVQVGLQFWRVALWRQHIFAMCHLYKCRYHVYWNLSYIWYGLYLFQFFSYTRLIFTTNEFLSVSLHYQVYGFWDGDIWNSNQSESRIGITMMNFRINITYNKEDCDIPFPLVISVWKNKMWTMNI